MTKTPNHNYSKPTKGTTNWHNPLNSNFDALDTEIEVRDKDKNRSEYNAKKGAKYEATDSGAIYYGDGSDWVLADRNVESIEVKKRTENEQSIRVVGSNGNFEETYQISNYNDIFDAIKQAQEDLPLRGGTIYGPTGVFLAGTQLNIYKPLNIFPNTGFVGKFNNADQAAQLCVQWNGSNTVPIVLRGTDGSPAGGGNRQRLEGVSLGSFLLRPDTIGDGDTAIIFDGTDKSNHNSTVIESVINGTVLYGWGGTSPVVKIEGTVFDIDITDIGGKNNSGDLIKIFDSPDATAGPPSGFDFLRPRAYTKAGDWAINAELNTFCLYGGGIQQSQHGANGIRVGASGNGIISGVKLEGNKNGNDGGVGIQVFKGNNSVTKLYPAKISKYDTGIQLGSSDGGHTNNVRIDTRFIHNGSEDVKLEPGGNKQGVKILCPTPAGITDTSNRINQSAEVILDTGEKTMRPFPNGNVSKRPNKGTQNQLFGTRFDNKTDIDPRSNVDFYDDDLGEWKPLHPHTGGYTGDGSSNKYIEINRYPNIVIIDDGSSTVMSLRNGGNIALRGSMNGSLAFESTGFTVGDGDSNRFPNKDGVTYDVTVL